MGSKTARNEITRDKIKTKPQNDKYATGWERIFGKKKLDETDSHGDSGGAEDNDKRPS